ETTSDTCNNCSSCVNEGTLTNKTVDAQKVLSCIYRMKREFGTTMLVDVLRGSTQKKVLDNMFHKISTYGIMKDYSKIDLLNFINTLISHGYITLKEGEYPVVKLNSLSSKVLKGESTVIFKEYTPTKKTEKDNDLFTFLKSLRLDIAKECKIPPYFIFSDTTLRGIASALPKTEAEMLKISGVGEKKFLKYGEKFLNNISTFIEEEKELKA
ncbi:MAG: RQC domain-containing protein, partial [Clostridium sp.]